MDSRSRVYAALDRTLDSRVPRDLWTLPWADRHHPDMLARGGVIAQCEFGPGAKPENVYEVFAAWDRLT